MNNAKSTGNSDKPIASTSKESKSNRTNIDAEIDIFSERFDPLKALYTENIHLQNRNIKIYDNISSYESAMRKLNENITCEENKSTNVKKSDNTQQLDTNEPIRNFLPHQGLVQGKGIKEKYKRNLLKKIEQGFYQGPLSMIKVYMDQKKRVKIYTRREHGVLGYLTGFVEMFDKHWNLVVSDVVEVWKRKKYDFSHVAATIELADCPTDIETSRRICEERLETLNLKFPKLTIKSLNRKYVECSRHLPQLIIRGEQIVLITLDIN